MPPFSVTGGRLQPLEYEVMRNRQAAREEEEKRRLNRPLPRSGDYDPEPSPESGLEWGGLGGGSDRDPDWDTVSAEVGGKSIVIQVEAGTSDEEAFNQLQIERRKEEKYPAKISQGFIPETWPGEVRQWVKRRPPAQRLAIEYGPTFAAEQIARRVGLGVPAGILTEYVAQKIGLTPKSTAALVLTGGAPLLLKVGGKAARGLWWGIKKFPMTGISIAKKIKDSEDAFGPAMDFWKRFRPEISAKRLFSRLAKNGVHISQAGMTSTKKVLQELRNELSAHPKASGVDDMITMVDSIDEKLFPKGTPARSVFSVIFDRAGKRFKKTIAAVPGKDIPWDTLQVQVSAVGRAIARLTREKGPKLGAAKKFYGAVFDDLERLARTGGLPPKQLALFNKARMAARREFAVEVFQSWVTDSVKPVGKIGGAKTAGVEINFKRVLQKLVAYTTGKPKTAFEKNFREALKFELPEIKKFVEDMVRLGPSGGVPAASLVIRGRQARLGSSLLSGLTGFLPFIGSGSPLEFAVAGAGAIGGAMAPELLAKMLLTPKGRNVLAWFLRRGTRTLDPRTLSLLAQTMRGVGQETVRGRQPRSGGTEDPMDRMLQHRYNQALGLIGRQALGGGLRAKREQLLRDLPTPTLPPAVKNFAEDIDRLQLPMGSRGTLGR